MASNTFDAPRQLSDADNVTLVRRFAGAKGETSTPQPKASPGESWHDGTGFQRGLR